jgi:hypothetical protein
VFERAYAPYRHGKRPDPEPSADDWDWSDWD